jgi:hypothetical protein
MYRGAALSQALTTLHFGKVACNCRKSSAAVGCINHFHLQSTGVRGISATNP